METLTKGMVFYSSALSEFEKLDFRSDALAGVRANYFNSDKQIQSDETEITIQSEIYKLSYKMVENQTLSWKVTKNQRPYQSVKRETGGIYCVKYYGENGNVYKRQYFDINHFWIKTEYYDKQIEGDLVCTISPKNVDDVKAIEKVTFDDNVITSVELLFPSNNPPSNISDALVYTNLGMIWYDKSFTPKNLADSYKVPHTANTFGISENLFDESYQPENKMDFSTLNYLEDITEEIKPEEDINTQESIVDETVANQNEVVESTYSAYDRIEKILTEANKINKNLFGEVLEYTDTKDSDESVEEDAIAENDHVSEELIDQILSEVSEMDKTIDEIDESEISKNKYSKPRHFAPDDDSSDIDTLDDEVNIESADDEEAYYAEISMKKETEAIEKAEAYELREKQISEYLVETQSGVYSYYGDTDEDGKRTGRGRTESPEGYTAYDGEYSNDKRDGFGVFYYKNGDINYVGEWSQNKRNGCGVGYRTSDGTMHIGKWVENKPENIGARFDKSGNFIDIANYLDGVKHGKCISLDERGNFVISVWENGEKISECVVDDSQN